MLDIIIRQSVTLDSDYQAVIRYAQTLGYVVPTPGQRHRQNQLIKSFKMTGIWAKLDLFYLFANNGSKEFATLNWKSPSLYQATLVNSPVFTTNQGIAGDGVAAYVDTNCNPATQGVNYTQDNAGRFAWVYSAVASNNIDGLAAKKKSL
jgi:hypothetical protein